MQWLEFDHISVEIISNLFESVHQKLHNCNQMTKSLLLAEIWSITKTQLSSTTLTVRF